MYIKAKLIYNKLNDLTIKILEEKMATAVQEIEIKKEIGPEKKIFGQISKFAVVGVLNTIIDLGIVNILILKFGFNPVLSNIIGVSAALINSYILNKRWTFEDRSDDKNATQFGVFVLLSLVGMAINTVVFIFLFKTWTLPGSIAYTIINFVKLNSIFGKEFVLLNFAKAFSLAFSMIWNFIAYKKWAFKK